MRRAGKIVAGLAAVVMSAGAAVAADVPVVVAPPMAPPPPPAPTFDWAGPYVGVHGGAFFYPPGLNFSNWRVGVQAGYNVVNGGLLFGVQGTLAAEIYPGPPVIFDGAILGRVGAIVGERVLVFGEAGLGKCLGCLGGGILAGAGVEVAVNQAISVFGEAVGLFPFGGGFQGVEMHVGLNWHIGN